jgi:hypothetical protein
MAALAWVQVAKHREHDGRDPAAALTATQRARSLAERSRLFGHPDRVVERDLPRRVARLRRVLAARPGSSSAASSPVAPATVGVAELGLTHTGRPIG